MTTKSAEKSITTTRQKLLPIVRELPADFETPASVYLKLANDKPSFLLESVIGGEHIARYSFIGFDLDEAFVMSEDKLIFHSSTTSSTILPDKDLDPLSKLNLQMSQYETEEIHGLPRFSGGLVGYLSYDLIRYFESSVPITPNKDFPDGIMLLAKNLVAFDHAFGRILLIANANIEEDRERGILEAEKRLDEIAVKIEAPLLRNSKNTGNSNSVGFESNISRKDFEATVLKAKEHITAGDIFQVVLSQKLTKETTAKPFDIYRSLRRLNPSPYMFFFNFGKLAGSKPMHIIGASPEMHVRLENEIAYLRPIAGTRSRGETPVQDKELEEELLADPKELAEHVMLVDLGRNDLGRVCEYGTVTVTQLMEVERYSHVMHIVSQIQGNIKPGLNGFELLKATFPAGTVSGAPKIRAMQIIDQLENASRGPYAGAIGYISFDGSLDSCIAIRTLVMSGSQISVQAGAGIVADSDPKLEYEETMHKAMALAEAVNMAEENTK